MQIPSTWKRLSKQSFLLNKRECSALRNISEEALRSRAVLLDRLHLVLVSLRKSLLLSLTLPYVGPQQCGLHSPWLQDPTPVSSSLSPVPVSRLPARILPTSDSWAAQLPVLNPFASLNPVTVPRRADVCLHLASLSVVSFVQLPRSPGLSKRRRHTCLRLMCQILSAPSAPRWSCVLHGQETSWVTHPLSNASTHPGFSSAS